MIKAWLKVNFPIAGYIGMGGFIGSGLVEDYGLLESLFVGIVPLVWLAMSAVWDIFWSQIFNLASRRARR